MLWSKDAVAQVPLSEVDQPYLFASLVCHRGAMRSKCTCASGKVWNRAEDVCEKCPMDAFCPGGKAPS